VSDPYVYPGTSVLRNKFDLRDADALEEVERRVVLAALYKLRMKPLKMPISIARLKATHKAIFSEIYSWAGEFRENTGSMRKWREAGYAVVYGPSTYVAQEMDRIFADLKQEGDLRGLSLDQFAAKAAFYYGEIDGTHPFREGNSRTIRQFFVDLAHGAGFDPDWSACGVDEAAGRALYHARDAAWMQAKPDALCAIIRAGLKPL
jgi:cell filamentation protein